MRFFKDFVNEVDGHGGKHSFDNTCNVRKKYLFIKKKKRIFRIIQRPQTCDSVMSEREAARPATASNVVLPR